MILILASLCPFWLLPDSIEGRWSAGCFQVDEALVSLSRAPWEVPVSTWESETKSPCLGFDMASGTGKTILPFGTC